MLVQYPNSCLMTVEPVATGRPSLWKVPLAVFLVSLALVSLLAREPHRTASAEADAQFEVAQATAETALESALSARITEFSAVVDLLRSSDDIDADQLDAFLNARRGNRSWAVGAADPGFAISEVVPNAEALYDLRDRERAAGRDFNLFPPFPLSSGERFVITHVERDTLVMGRPYVGFDVTDFANLLKPAAESVHGLSVTAEVTPISDLVGGLEALGSASLDAQTAESVVIYLISVFETADGSIRGYATQLESLSEIVADVELAVPEHFGLSIAFRDAEPLAAIDRLAGAPVTRTGSINFADGATNEFLNLDELTVVFTASDNIESPSARTESRKLWISGLAAAMALAVLAAMRSIHARRLIDTTHELARAQTEALTEPLTGLLNRKGLALAIEELDPSSGSLLFIDVDNFKSVNDQDGHEYGDRILREIATVLNSSVRSNDLVCRLGGDEFLVFLDGVTERDRLDHVVQRIEHEVGDIDYRISASIGVSIRSQDSGVSLEEMLRQSDEAMYRVKRTRPSHGHAIRPGQPVEAHDRQSPHRLPGVNGVDGLDTPAPPETPILSR